MSPDAVVVAARRTPVATVGRALSQLTAPQLVAPVLTALDADLATLLGPQRAGIGDVVLGNCRGPGGNVARVAALSAGLARTVPGVSVDRQCGSGLDAVRIGAALIRSGELDVVLAGGVESASQAPGGPGRRARFAPEHLGDPDMGPAAEAAAARRGISRERQDAYAARSHARTLAARQAGVFEPELVPLAGFSLDDRPRAGLTAQRLARFHPAFAPDGSVTAGNACGVSDGAAALALVSEPLRQRAGVPGLKVLAAAVAGDDPALPALAAAPAVRAVLARAGVGLNAVAVLEVTEAFAAQLLACTDELGLDPLGGDAERVCPDGGAIAMGHPWAASGALLVVRLFARLVRRDGPAHGRPDPPRGAGEGRYGVAACAIGGGQGLAVLFERVG